jgi:hypothetical protein
VLLQLLPLQLPPLALLLLLLLRLLLVSKLLLLPLVREGPWEVAGAGECPGESQGKVLLEEEDPGTSAAAADVGYWSGL